MCVYIHTLDILYMTLDHKTSLKLLGYIVNMSLKSLGYIVNMSLKSLGYIVNVSPKICHLSRWGIL